MSIPSREIHRKKNKATRKCDYGALRDSVCVKVGQRKTTGHRLINGVTFKHSFSYRTLF